MSNTDFTLALALMPKLKPGERLLLSNMLPDLETLLRMKVRDLSYVVGRSLPLSREEMKMLPAELERVIRFIEKSGTRLIDYWSESYPPLLREIHDPPFLLYLRGQVPERSTPAVAVVGTRKAGEEELEAAFTFSAELSLSGLPIISGLARGIDRAAHEAAYRCGGYTMAVLGSGPDVIYPAAHRHLVEGILSSGGALLSEYPPGTPPLRYHFPARNRIITGISRATMVVAAPRRSGALISADYALEQGRDLYIHPAGLAQAGTKDLFRQGASVIRNASQLLEQWGYSTGKAGRCEKIGQPLERSGDMVRGELEGHRCFYRGTWYDIQRSPFRGSRRDLGSRRDRGEMVREKGSGEYSEKKLEVRESA
jgi:DNA processing protein